MRNRTGFMISSVILLIMGLGGLARAETYTASVILSPGAEVNPSPPPPATATGGMVVTINVTRDGTGAITAATMNFLGTVSFPGPVTVVGLHIHEGTATENGSVRFNSGLNATTNQVLPTGVGLINRDVTSVDLTVLGRLLSNPTKFYVNIHTTDNTAGAIRGQIVKLVETVANTVAMTTAAEIAPPVPLPDNVSGTGTITANPTRDPVTGTVTGGTVTFTVTFDFPGAVTFTGLHIHEGAAGTNGSVVINTGISASNPFISDTGKGTINIMVPLTTDSAKAAFGRMLQNPSGFYVNLHSTTNTAGVIRGQLTGLAAPPVIQQSDIFFLETGSTDATVKMLATGIDLASSITINGQTVLAIPDLTSGLLTVTVPGALRTNAGRLMVRAKNGQGLLSLPIVIVVAATASVNSTAVSTTDAAGFGGSVSPDGIAAAFGTQLASQTTSSTAVPLPTSLDGTSVYVNGVAAGLFFVASGQINFLVPSSTATGVGQIVVIARDGTLSRGTLNIAPSSASIFTSKSDGTGAPAAVASTDGVAFTILMGNPDGTPIAINAGNYVALFGTGVRYASTAMTMTIGTENVAPLFAGPQGVFQGLDQINLQIPMALAGKGAVDLIFSIDGKSSNKVKLIVN